MSGYAIIQGSSKGLGRAITRNLLLNHKSLKVVATTSTSVDQARESILSSFEDKGDAVAGRLTTLKLDVTNEDSIQEASQTVSDRFGRDMRLLVNVSGMLHAERSLGEVDLEQVTRSFQLNTIGHLLVYKHMISLLPPRKDTPPEEDQQDWMSSGRSVLVSLSARVGSIADNHKGGWYSYRSSKAATNQIIRTLAHELDLHKHSAIAFAYHPGTVKTALSEPYVKGKEVDDSTGLFTPERAAEKFLEVLKSGLVKNGGFVDWAGNDVPW